MDRRSWVKAAGVFLLSPLTLLAAGKRKEIRIPELFEEFNGEGAELIWEYNFSEGSHPRVCQSWRLRNKRRTRVTTEDGKVTRVLLGEEERANLFEEYCRGKHLNQLEDVELGRRFLESLQE